MHFLWVAAYGFVHMLSSYLSQAMALPAWVTPLAMLGYTGALIHWIFKTGQHRKYGLCPLCKTSRAEYLLLLPLLLLPVRNLLIARTFSPQLSAVLLMLSICAAEEIFFRGFLLHFLKRFGTGAAVLLSSIAFALFHFTNLAGSGSIPYTLMQVLCACAAGICYGAVTVRFQSLLPAFGAHFFTNITASGEQLQWLWVCIALYGCYGIYLTRKIVSK